MHTSIWKPAPFTVALMVTVGILAAATVVHADTTTYNLTLTTSSPTFNRPVTGNPPTSLSGVGSSVFYNLQPFFVSTTGTYTLQTTAAALTPGNPVDTFLALYQGSFNPATPLVNIVQADDDGGDGNLSLFARALTGSTQYFLVTTTFGNGVTGAITTSIGQAGSGTVTLGTVPTAVPEANAFALALPALGMIGAVISRRRKK